MAETGTNPDGTERSRLDQLPRQANLAGWPTPKALDMSGGGSEREAMLNLTGQARESGATVGPQLRNTVLMAGWPTPNTLDTVDREGLRPSRVATNRESGYLTEIVPLSGWPTPSAEGSAGETSEDLERVGEKWVNRKTGRVLQTNLATDAKMLAGPARLTASGEMLTGLDAAMGSGGQLNPAHSRWLMGVPPEWDDFACTATALLSRSRKRSSKQ